MKEDIVNALRNLTPSTDTARLRESFSEVDAALRSGVSREAVWKALKERGFTFTLNAFNSAVTRIRKEKTSKSPTKTENTENNVREVKQVSTETKQAPVSVSDGTIKTPKDIHRARNREIDLDDFTSP